MAGDWIKVQTCTPDKPEVHQIAETLGIDPDAVVGKLIRVWAWADMQTIDGNAVSVTKSLLDRITCVTGFANAMIAAGWMTTTDTGVQFERFDRHNGKTAKTRGLCVKRVANMRSSNADVTVKIRKCNAASVTDALPEKRREENIEAATASAVHAPAKAKTPTPRFEAPTIEDVQYYAEGANITIDAERFVDHYTSNGWRVGGKTAMKDWRAAVRNWAKNNITTGSQANGRYERKSAAQTREDANAAAWDICEAAAAADHASSSLDLPF
jgi:hypothetical protein